MFLPATGCPFQSIIFVYVNCRSYLKRSGLVVSQNPVVTFMCGRFSADYGAERGPRELLFTRM